MPQLEPVKRDDEIIAIYHNEKLVVRLKTDRTMIFGDDYQPDKAAMYFWQAVLDNYPCWPERKYKQ